MIEVFEAYNVRLLKSWMCNGKHHSQWRDEDYYDHVVTTKSVHCINRLSKILFPNRTPIAYRVDCNESTFSVASVALHYMLEKMLENRIAVNAILGTTRNKWTVIPNLFPVGSEIKVLRSEKSEDVAFDLASFDRLFDPMSKSGDYEVDPYDGVRCDYDEEFDGPVITYENDDWEIIDQSDKDNSNEK